MIKHAIAVGAAAARARVPELIGQALRPGEASRDEPTADEPMVPPAAEAPA
jgi:hypothetical protein